MSFVASYKCDFCGYTSADHSYFKGFNVHTSDAAHRVQRSCSNSASRHLCKLCSESFEVVVITEYRVENAGE